MQIASTHPRIPAWFWIATALGLAWNLYGVAQFLTSLSANRGQPSPQAEIMLHLPLWMNIAFATGVFGGVLGCILLSLRKQQATAVFILSLIGYLVLYLGDITQGVFSALGVSQIVVLSMVVLIAGALLWLSRHLQRTLILS